MVHTLFDETMHGKTMTNFLPSAAAVHAKLRKLFSSKTRGRRRVACVAYVGVDAPSLLPDYEGVEVYCWPQPGATDPNGLSRISQLGANVFLVDRLHAKLYWVENEGYVVTSANLSSNALGEHGLHEVGIFVTRTDLLDIETFLQQFSKCSLTRKELIKLQKEHDRFWSTRREPSKLPLRAPAFIEWLNGPQYAEWKLGWWDTEANEEKSTAAEAREIYGVHKIDDYIDCHEDQFSRGDWVLTYCVNGDGSIGKLGWLYVNHVHALTSAEVKRVGFTHQAIQLRKPRFPMRPPFSLSTDGFQSLFRAAVAAHGVTRLIAQSNFRPTTRFMTLLRDFSEKGTKGRPA
jgi:hypothetical protein